MAKKRANRGKPTLTGKQRTETLSDQQRLRRAELKVQRIEAQLYGKVSRDVVISDHLEGLPRGERGAFIKDAIEEKIAAQVAARNEQAATANALDELRTQIAELQEENTKLRLGGSVPFEEKSTTVLDEEQHAALSGKLKKLKMGFAGL